MEQLVQRQCFDLIVSLAHWRIAISPAHWNGGYDLWIEVGLRLRILCRAELPEDWEAAVAGVNRWPTSNVCWQAVASFAKQSD